MNATVSTSDDIQAIVMSREVRAIYDRLWRVIQCSDREGAAPAYRQFRRQDLAAIVPDGDGAIATNGIILAWLRLPPGAHGVPCPITRQRMAWVPADKSIPVDRLKVALHPPLRYSFTLTAAALLEHIRAPENQREHVPQERGRAAKPVTLAWLRLPSQSREDPKVWLNVRFLECAVRVLGAEGSDELVIRGTSRASPVAIEHDRDVVLVCPVVVPWEGIA